MRVSIKMREMTTFLEKQDFVFMTNRNEDFCHGIKVQKCKEM
jgi:hypothetical protein